jgi:hypothetical protein
MEADCQRHDERVKPAHPLTSNRSPDAFLDFPISARWIAHVTRARLGALGVRDSRPWGRAALMAQGFARIPESPRLRKAEFRKITGLKLVEFSVERPGGAAGNRTPDLCSAIAKIWLSGTFQKIDSRSEPLGFHAIAHVFSFREIPLI